jgi:hypothetical protein
MSTKIREINMSGSITDILSSFSTNQLRDLALAMGARGVPLPKATLGKDELLSLLKSRKNNKTLALFAHRIEAVTPYKHLFVYSIDAKRITFPWIIKKINSAFPAFVGGNRQVDAQVDLLQAQACLADENQEKVYLKLVHLVEMSGWETVSRTEKKLRTFRKRHPVVVTIRPKDGILTIGFPGFSFAQGLQREDRVAYAAIAAQGTEFINAQFQIECIPFRAKAAIDSLLEEEPDEVNDVKRNVRPKKGGRFAFDAGEEGKLTASLADFFAQEGEIPVSETQIRNLLRRSGASDIVLFWKRLQIFTRVALLQNGGPEFLFIWRDSGPSSSVVDSVLSKVSAYAKLLNEPKVSAIRKAVLSTPVRQIIQPALAAQMYGISQNELLEIITLAVSRGDFRPQFRVNTDRILVDHTNNWQPSLSEFPKTVTDEDGTAIDLTDPKNIEVAFERVK